MAAWKAIIPTKVRTYNMTLKLPRKAAIKAPRVTDEKVIVNDHGLVARKRVFAFKRSRLYGLALLKLVSSVRLQQE